MLDFLTLKPDAFGLDISDLSLKIVKLEKKSRGLALASFGETMIAPGIIEKGEIKDEKALISSVKKALGQAKGKKIKTRYVVASLPEEKAFLQVIKLPKMNDEEAKKAVYFEIENYIPLPIRDVYIDCQIVNAENQHKHIEVLVAASPQEIINPYLSSLKEAGLIPQALEVESQAISRALVKDNASAKPLLLIDLGFNRTSFIIFLDSSLRFTASRLISSQQFTELIAQDFKVSPKKAEALKIKHGIGKSRQGRQIFKSLTPVLNELSAQIGEYLDYCRIHYGQEIGKILLCGGGVNLKGLGQFLAFQNKVSVEIGNPWVNISPRPLKEIDELPRSESLRYTTALGLALRSFKND